MHLTVLSLLWTGGAVHAASDACEAYCDQLLAQATQACDNDTSCLATADAAYDECVGPCPVEVVVPDVAALRDHGMQAAEHYFGPVRLLDEQIYQHPDGRPQSLLLVVSTDPDIDRDTVRSAIEAGADPAAYDDVVRGIEISARLEMPPVVARWTGVPFEYVADRIFARHADARYGTTEFQLVERWQSPVFPVFVYEVDGRQVWFDPRTGGVAENVSMHVNEPIREDERWILRLERLKREWIAFLEGSAFDGEVQ